MGSAILLLIFVLTAIGTVAQPQQDPRKEAKIAEIRQTFQRINKERNYQLIKVENAEEILGHATDGGASITGYYKENVLQKMTEWVGLSGGVIQNEYYFDKGSLVFVYSTEQRYPYNDSLEALDKTKLVPSFFWAVLFQQTSAFRCSAFTQTTKTLHRQQCNRLS